MAAVKHHKFRLGSMQLSIEAIIILVIAIVLLGLGIAFIKNFFAKGSEALLGQFDPLKEGCNVDSNTNFLPKTFSLTAGGTSSANICVFNDQTDKIKSAKIWVKECLPPGAGTAVSSANSISIHSLGLDIDRGKSAGYKATIDASKAATLGTYICSIFIATNEHPGANDLVIGPVQATFTLS